MKHNDKKNKPGEFVASETFKTESKSSTEEESQR